MVAVVLNSGKGSRLGSFTQSIPKCMVEILNGQTILEYQLKLLMRAGIQKVIITTGYLCEKLESHVKKLGLDLDIIFIENPQYESTNYIKSIDFIPSIEEDILLLHGDLIFEEKVLEKIMGSSTSSMVIDSTIPLPKKDFKAVINKEGRLKAVGIHYFNENSYSAQPLYKLLQQDWNTWKYKIHQFCEEGKDNVYAEEALNEITKEVYISGINIYGLLCGEVDSQEDLIIMREKLNTLIS